MPGSTNHKYSLRPFRPESSVSPEEYAPFIGQKRVDSLKSLARPLQGRKWTHINSTMDGGGVAELLRGVVPLAASLGIDASWYVMSGRRRFFEVTKKFHNLLQGVKQRISIKDLFDTYLETISANGVSTSIESDVIVVHDPQPIGLVNNGVLFGNVLWRCHIDTSAPDLPVWRFLLPYINQCAGAIFTMPEFVGPGVLVPQYQILPCIDPLTEKNRERSREEALDVLAPLLEESDVDPERPIFAAISRYDVHKNQEAILKAFRLLRRNRRFDPPPYLIFLGNKATDDPEGETMLLKLKASGDVDPDVRFWVNVADNDRVVGALNRIARGVVHVSTKEGFGLVVSEALWQGTPVIGSRTGGIVKQVAEGKNGFLVDPTDVDGIAARMARLLERPDEARRLGECGREHVRRNFLLPELVRNHLALMRHYAGIDASPPRFRLNGRTYVDRIARYRARFSYQ